MKELKEKVVLLRYLKGLFYLTFVISAILFVVFTIFQNDSYVRNAAISLVIMAFGYISVEVINYKINEFLNEYRILKTIKHNNKANIIEFDKIA